MPAFYSASVGEFLNTPPQRVIDRLSNEQLLRFVVNRAAQIESWEAEISLLRNVLTSEVSEADTLQWGILLEYPLHRLEKRIDAILLIRNSICCIEFKNNVPFFLGDDIRQTNSYAFALKH